MSRQRPNCEARTWTKGKKASERRKIPMVLAIEAGESVEDFTTELGTRIAALAMKHRRKATAVSPLI